MVCEKKSLHTFAELLLLEFGGAAGGVLYDHPAYSQLQCC